MNRSMFIKTLGVLCIAPLVAAKTLIKEPTKSRSEDRPCRASAQFDMCASDLAAAYVRASAAATTAGVSFHELIDTITEVSEATGRSGAVIGNSLKTIFTRLPRPKTDALLNRVGIQTTGRPAMAILRDLRRVWPTLPLVSRRAITEQIGGAYQINVIGAILA